MLELVDAGGTKKVGCKKKRALEEEKLEVDGG